MSHVQLLFLISIADIACMNSYPASESCAAPLLNFYCWHCLHELLSSKQVMCSSSAWSPLMTLLAWTSIQGVSLVQLLCLIFIADIACKNSYPGCESCIAPLLNFHCQHCLYEFLSRKWVSVPLLNLSSAWFWLLIYYLVYCPVCSYFNALSFSHSVNTSTCHR